MEVTPGSSSRSGMTYSSPQTPSNSNPFRNAARNLANMSPQIVSGVSNADLVDVLVDVSHRVNNYVRQEGVPQISDVVEPFERRLNQGLRDLARRVFAPHRASRYSRGSRRKMWLKRPYRKK